MAEDTYKTYEDLANHLVLNDAGRDTKFRAMDDYDHVDWQAPDEFVNESWFYALPSTGPHDALNTGARVLSTVTPKVTYHPMDDTQLGRERASEIEKILTWHYIQASRRSVNNVGWDIVMSAIKYDNIACQVIFLPWQRKLAKSKTKEPWGQRADFAILTHNPKTVHVYRTSYGVEGVVLCKVVPVNEITRQWGQVETIEKPTKAGKLQYAILYDYMDIDRRVVWCYPFMDEPFIGQSVFGSQPYINEAIQGNKLGQRVEIYNDDHGLPFLPWVLKAGGTNLEDDSEFQSRPLLDAIYLGGSWETTCFLRSLRMSLALAHGAAPRSKSFTSDGKSPPIDYRVPGGNVALQSGSNEDFVTLDAPVLDPALSQADNELEAAMASSTVPKLLQDPNLPSNAAFASINTLLRQASTVLDPYKRLAEHAFEEVFIQMLWWSKFTHKSLSAFDQVSAGDQYGQNYVLPWKEIDPENIYLEVELTASFATDMLQTINEGVMMRQLGVSQNRILEHIHIPDPDVVFEEYTYEQLAMAEVQRALKLIGAEGDAAAQKIIGAVQMQLQMQAQQEAQAQMQAQQPQQPMGGGQGGGPEPVSFGGAPATPQEAQQQALARAAANVPPNEQLGSLGIMTEAAKEQTGFNPAQGGMPPATIAPGVTREAVTGRTRRGEPTK